MQNVIFIVVRVLSDPYLSEAVAEVVLEVPNDGVPSIHHQSHLGPLTESVYRNNTLLYKMLIHVPMFIIEQIYCRVYMEITL